METSDSNGEKDRLIRASELGVMLNESRPSIWRKVQKGILPEPFRMEGDAPNSPCRWWLSDIKKAIGAEGRNL